MAQRIVETVLRFKVDQAQVQSAQRALDGLRADVLKSAGQSGTIGSVSSRARTGVQSISESAAQKLVDGLQSATDQIPVLGDAIRGLSQSAEQGVTQIIQNNPKLVAALGVAGGALVLLSAQAAKVREAALNELQARGDVVRLLEVATSAEIKARVDELTERRRILEAQASDSSAVLQQLRNDTAATYGPVLAGIAEINSTLRTGAGELTAAKENADRAQAALNQTNTELILLEQALASGAATAKDAAEAERQLAEARINNVIRINDNFINAQLEAANLAATGTEEAVQARIDALVREQEVLVENAAIIQGQVDAAAGNAEAQKAFQGQLDGVNNRIQAINNTLTVFANEGLLETARAADAAKAALEEETRIRESSIGVVKKYNEEVERIREQAAQQEIALADRLADQQVQIAERAAQDAQKALDNLQKARAGLGTDLTRDLASAADDARREALDRQIEFQRDEVESTIRHQADLERIRRGAQEREFELGLSRDFAGLARSRRQTAGDLSEANQRFAEDRAQRARAFAAETEDNARQYAAEREQRIAKYQQDLIDAEQAYRLELAQSRQQTQRSLNEANAAYNRDLAQLRAKLTAELAARQQAAIGELRIIQQGQAVKLKLEEQYWIQAQKLVLAATANLGGSSTPSSSGGPGLPKSMSNIRAVGSSSAAAAGGSSGPQINLTLNVPITTGASADQVRGLPGAVQQIVRRELVAVFS